MREHCAVLGVRANHDVYPDLNLGLLALQHRGQESAGVALNTAEGIRVHKAMGLVEEALRDVRIPGHVGIGHVRYSTFGQSKIENAQPLLINYAKGSFAIAHNGNIVNGKELRDRLEAQGNIFSTTTDTEVIAHLIARSHIRTGSLTEGIRETMRELVGAYSITLLAGDALFALRDPWGVRPLVYGRSQGMHAIASESCALDALGLPRIRDVQPGEVLVIDGQGHASSTQMATTQHAHCMFEYVYFSRPDSVIQGISVYKVRKNLGRRLHEDSAKLYPSLKPDVVIAVPNSGVTAAIGYAQASGIPYSEGLMKNVYVGRSFIMPEQRERERAVKVKLNPIKSEVEGKVLVLVDDSIVRGTTIRKLVGLLKKAGAKEVHLRITCPPIKHPCLTGIDMQTAEQFIANEKTVEEIRKQVGADTLYYNTVQALVDSIGMPAESLCMACLNGCYPVHDPQKTLLESCECALPRHDGP